MSDTADDQLKLLLMLTHDWLNGDRTHAAEIYELAASLGMPPMRPPTNVDVPYAEQAGAELTCTMGNWNGEPTGYSYQWVLDGITDIGTGAASYAVTADDVGHTVTCVVRASNAIGSTTAPPSNGVVVAAPAQREAHGAGSSRQAQAQEAMGTRP